MPVPWPTQRCCEAEPRARPDPKSGGPGQTDSRGLPVKLLSESSLSCCLWLLPAWISGLLQIGAQPAWGPTLRAQAVPVSVSVLLALLWAE